MTWRFKYHLHGKREKITTGAYPAFTIKQACDRHEELRALLSVARVLLNDVQNPTDVLIGLFA